MANDTNAVTIMISISMLRFESCATALRRQPCNRAEATRQAATCQVDVDEVLRLRHVLVQRAQARASAVKLREISFQNVLQILCKEHFSVGPSMQAAAEGSIDWRT